MYYYNISLPVCQAVFRLFFYKYFLSFYKYNKY